MTYGVPVVCMVFNPKDNFCHLDKLPAIKSPPPNPFDPISKVLEKSLKQIEDIRQKSCETIGKTNTVTLNLWLWNTDPDLKELGNALGGLQSDPAAAQTIQGIIATIRSIANGLGLLPRELLLRERIRTLNEYVNAPGKTNVSLAQVNQMNSASGSSDPAFDERTIQAFLSAYYTLGNNTFASDSVFMDELTPETLLKLEDIKIRFDTYAIDLKAPTGEGDCIPTAQNDTIKSEFPIGVYKDSKALTYYAVRLKGKAKVMFSPFGDMELKAYSAAQPFGSRIGPKLTANDFVSSGRSFAGAQNSNLASAQELVNDLAGSIPNLPLKNGESTQTGSGWDNQSALNAFYMGLSANGDSLPESIDSGSLSKAYQTAMTANPYEASRYNIVNDLNVDPFVRNFDKENVLAFWAPIVSPKEMSSLDSKLLGLVDTLLGGQGASAQAIKDGLKKQLSTYITALKEGKGEVVGLSRESLNIARIEDPFKYSSGTTPGAAISVKGGYSENDPKKIKSSWNQVLDSQFQSLGRVGYSVKFVSFDSLTKNRMASDVEKTMWSNTISNMDDEAKEDLSAIQH